MMLARIDWMDRAAPVLRQLARRDRAANRDERAILADEPRSDAALEIALRAWRDTSSCRVNGWSIGPIPQTAIDAWCDRHGLTQETNDFLTDALRYVDAELIARRAKA